MRNRFTIVLAVAAAAVLLSGTLGAKNTARGGMHIPVVGLESFDYIYPGTGTFEVVDGILQIRGLVADLRWVLSMPSLGIEDLELIVHATGSQDREGGILLLKAWNRGEILAGGEVIGYYTAVDLPVPLGGTMYETTLNVMGVFFEGPLKGCTFQWTAHSIGGIQGPNPPDYLAEIKGFLIVPDNLDIGKKGKK